MPLRFLEGATLTLKHWSWFVTAAQFSHFVSPVHMWPQCRKGVQRRQSGVVLLGPGVGLSYLRRCSF